MQRLAYGVSSLIALASVPALAAGLTLASPDMAPEATLKPAQVYRGYGCTGGNLSPALNWSGEPAGTRSFAITVFDPDAPTGHGWWHWLAIDLPPTIHRLASGAALPAGTLSLRNDFGAPGYGGACPPEGDKPHHYHFTIWALKTPKLGLGPNASAGAVMAALRANVLEKAEITARYGR